MKRRIEDRANNGNTHAETKASTLDVIQMLINASPSTSSRSSTNSVIPLRISTPSTSSMMKYPPSPPGPPPMPSPTASHHSRQSLKANQHYNRSSTHPTPPISPGNTDRSFVSLQASPLCQQQSHALTPTITLGSIPTNTITSPRPIIPGSNGYVTFGTQTTLAGSQFGPYVIERTLGQGSYGKVKLAYNSHTREKVAMKFIHKSSIKKDTHLVRIRREVRLLRLISHPNIIKLYHVIETEADIVLIMEHASGGELLEYVQSQGRLSEQYARPLFRQILSSVAYLHHNCLLHRDLKPQNLLLSTRDELHPPTIKLVDFGFANLFDPKGSLGTFCGSPYYASPEMVSGKKYVGPEVDVWSLGVILYSMLVGSVPFNDEHVKGLYAKILSGKYETPAYLSPLAKDLISSMLNVDSNHRIPLSKVLTHPWICSGDSIFPPDAHITERSSIIQGGPLLQHSFSSTSQLDPRILAKLKDYQIHIDPIQATRSILNDPNGKIASVYWLLYEKRQSEIRYGILKNSDIRSRTALQSFPPLITSSGFVIPDRILSVDEVETWDDLMNSAGNIHLNSPNSPLSASEILQNYRMNGIASQNSLVHEKEKKTHGWASWFLGKFGNTGNQQRMSRKERIHPSNNDFNPEMHGHFVQNQYYHPHQR